MSQVQLAIEEQQLTQLEIDNAIAISEEVMKEQLKLRSEGYRAQIHDKKAEISVFYKENIEPMLDRLIKQAQLKASKDPRFLAFFRAAQALLPANTRVNRNLDLTSHYMKRCIEGEGINSPSFRNKEGVFEGLFVSISMSEHSIYCTENDRHEPGLQFPLELTAGDMVKLNEHAELINQLKTISELHSKARDELAGIADKSKQLKTQLLAQQLSRTERGKQVLDAVTALVSNALGETPALLANKG